MLNYVSQLANTEMDFIIGLSKTTGHKHYVANVPADLRSAGNEYQDLFNPITSYLTSPYIFNANLALDFSLLTS